MNKHVIAYLQGVTQRSVAYTKRDTVALVGQLPQ